MTANHSAVQCLCRLISYALLWNISMFKNTVFLIEFWLISELCLSALSSVSLNQRQLIEKLLWNYNPHCHWTCSYQLAIEGSKMRICLCENAPGRWWNSNLVFTRARRLQTIYACHVNETTGFQIQGRRLENVICQILRQILIPLQRGKATGLCGWLKEEILTRHSAYLYKSD